MKKATTTETVTAPTGVYLMTKAEVLAKVKLSYPTIWNLMRAGKFPRSRSHGVGGQKAVWIGSEIDEWMLTLPQRELKAPDEKSA